MTTPTRTTTATPLLEPFARVPCVNSTDSVNVGDGTVAFLGADERFVFVDGDGAVVDELEMPERGMHPAHLEATPDGLVTGWDHTRGGVLFARRGAGQVKLWRNDKDFRYSASVAPIAGVGALVHSRYSAGIVGEDLSYEPLRFPFPEPRILAFQGIYWWNHDLLLTSCVPHEVEPDDVFEEPYQVDREHRYHCVGGDGVVRFEGTGTHARPLDDDLALVSDDGGDRLIDRDGATVDVLDRRISPSWYLPQFRYRGDVIAQVRGAPDDGLVRFTPRKSSTPHWWTHFARGSSFHCSPVIVGRHIAVLRETPDGALVLVVVVADSGAHVAEHAVPDINKDEHAALVAAGGDALFVHSGRWDGTSLLWRDVTTAAGPTFAVKNERQHWKSHAPRPGVLACKMTQHVLFYRVPR